MFCWDDIDRQALATLLKLKDAGLLKNFYLTGGTGLAIQLGHRVSLDLDLFTEHPTAEIPTTKLLSQCVKHFGTAKVKTIINAPDQLWIEIDGVKVTFLAFPYARKYKLLTNEKDIPLADARDIAAQKALAIGQRNHARDYVDLAWVLRKGVVTVDQIIEDAKEVFTLDNEEIFSPRLFLQQLAYTNDLRDTEDTKKSLHTHEDFAVLASELVNAVNHASRKLLQSARDKTKNETI